MMKPKRPSEQMPMTIDDQWRLYLNQLEQYVKLVEQQLLLKDRIIAGIPEEDGA